ncbi:MAG TPA: GNAT family N-acetyltransferase [Chitinispirillaceae bacterium]|nr:GNAT family N-acetyltransferase [Chitinispirillaceae bacterium]
MSDHLTEAKAIHIVKADFKSVRDVFAVISLINEYRNDPMGGNMPVLTPEAEIALIDGLKNHPVSIVLLALCNEEAVGLIVCLLGFSTFKAKMLLNVHDIIVKKQYRRQGIGKKLLFEAAKLARDADCCRLTLEVRNDNHDAKQLYSSVGFGPCDDPMEFWIMPLE